MGVRLKGDFNKLVKTLEKASRLDIKNRIGKPIGAALVTSTRERFRISRAPDGTPWKPLADSTIRSGVKKKDYTKSGKLRKKAAERQAKRLILVQRGRLKNSIISRAEGTQVMVGSNVDYARIHQKGGKTGRGGKVTIPARPYLGFSDDDRREIERLTAKGLQDLLK